MAKQTGSVEERDEIHLRSERPTSQDGRGHPRQAPADGSPGEKDVCISRHQDDATYVKEKDSPPPRDLPPNTEPYQKTPVRLRSSNKERNWTDALKGGPSEENREEVPADQQSVHSLSMQSSSLSPGYISDNFTAMRLETTSQYQSEPSTVPDQHGVPSTVPDQHGVPSTVPDQHGVPSIIQQTTGTSPQEVPSQTQLQSRPQPKPQHPPQTQPESKPQQESQTQPQPQTKTPPQPPPQSQPQSKPQSQSQPLTRPDGQTTSLHSMFTPQTQLEGTASGLPSDTNERTEKDGKSAGQEKSETHSKTKKTGDNVKEKPKETDTEPDAEVRKAEKGIVKDEAAQCSLPVDFLLVHDRDTQEVFSKKEQIIHEMSAVHARSSLMKTAYGLGVCHLNLQTWQLDSLWKEQIPGQNIHESGVRNILKEMAAEKKTIGHVVQYFTRNHSKRLDIVDLIKQIHQGCSFCDSIYAGGS